MTIPTSHCVSSEELGNESVVSQYVDDATSIEVSPHRVEPYIEVYANANNLNESRMPTFDFVPWISMNWRDIAILFGISAMIIVIGWAAGIFFTGLWSIDSQILRHTGVY